MLCRILCDNGKIRKNEGMTALYYIDRERAKEKTQQKRNEDMLVRTQSATTELHVMKHDRKTIACAINAPVAWFIYSKDQIRSGCNASFEHTGATRSYQESRTFDFYTYIVR